MLQSLKKFRRSEAAVSVVEFALLMPFFAFALFGEWEMFLYSMATQRLQITAESVAQMFASAVSPTKGGNGYVGDADISFFVGAAPFLYPDVLTSPQVVAGQTWSQVLEIDIASIQMILQSDGTTYKPQTAWTTGTGANARKCNTVYTAVADTAGPSPTTLPTDVIGPNSIIVVDVHMTYQPTVGATFVPSIDIARTVYMTPRNVPFVGYNGAGTNATVCS